MAEAVPAIGPKRIAVVTGGNKGIGLAICRQSGSNGVMVVLTARDEKRGVEAVENLKTSGVSNVIFHQLDVTDQISIASLVDFIKTKFGKLDILVNNAGIAGIVKVDDLVGPNAKPLKEVINQNYKASETCLRTNYYGVKLVTKELIHLLQLSDTPRLVNISSTLGQLKRISNEKAKKELSEIDSLTEEKVDNVVKGFLEDVEEDLIETKGWPVKYPAYIVSKAALNAYTRFLAKKYPTIAINAVSPGHVKTDLNNNTGVLTVEEGAKSPVMLALMPDGGPSGLFFDRTEITTY